LTLQEEGWKAEHYGREVLGRTLGVVEVATQLVVDCAEPADSNRCEAARRKYSMVQEEHQEGQEEHLRVWLTSRQDCVLYLGVAMLRAGGWESSPYCSGGQPQNRTAPSAGVPSLVSRYILFPSALVPHAAAAAAALRAAGFDRPYRRARTLDRARPSEVKSRLARAFQQKASRVSMYS
jgi:hypothetical protein